MDGFLAVSSQPSSHLPLEEFHEWYEGEHIPLRLNYLEEFLSGARYKAHSRQLPQDDSEGSSSKGKEDDDTGSNRPFWLALYTVTSPTFFSSQSYTNLRTNRSEREKSVMNRIEVLTRLTGKVVTLWSHDDQKTIGLKLGYPPGWVITHGLRIRHEDEDDGINHWASLIEQEANKCLEIQNGWARTRIVRVLDSGVTRFGVRVEADREEYKMPYFVVHEFKDEASAEYFRKLILPIPNYKDIDLGESNLWELYKAYPCLSQGNLCSSNDQ